MTPKQKLIAAVGAAALLGGSFAAGRFSSPAKVETVYQDKEVIVWRDREVAAETKTIQRHTEQRKAPPATRQPEQPKQPDQVQGCLPCVECVECPPVDETVTDEVVASVTTTASDSSGTIASEHETSTKVESKKPWLHVGPYVALQPTYLQKGAFEPKYGAKVALRLVGPLWLDLASTIERNPAVNLGLSLEF